MRSAVRRARGLPARGRPARGRPAPDRRRYFRRDDGALILTYVIIVPVFMLAIMVIIQGALWYLAREAALAAARQGVDAARVRGATAGAGPQAALAFARNNASGYLLGPAATDRGSTATTIQIKVSGHVPTFVPGVAINISQVARAPAEKFVAPGGP
jgi:Flp pilus assembly protein TadG